MDLARELMTDDGRSNLACFDQFVEVNAGLNAHAVQHVDEILRREVPCRTRRERTAAEAAHRGVERAHAELEPDDHVGERGAARVVHVHRERRRRVIRQEKPEDVAGAAIFLVSDQAAFLTGQMLMVNGGVVM